MKTSMLFALGAILTAVAVAGVAAASGPVASALGMQGSDDGACSGNAGDSHMHKWGHSRQYQSQYNGTGDCPGAYDWNHSWEYKYDYEYCPC